LGLGLILLVHHEKGKNIVTPNRLMIPVEPA